MKILNNGIYFNQSDEKEDGYYETINNDGSIEKHKYVEPSNWDKIRYYIKYGYKLNTETTITSFFHFNSYLKGRVLFENALGDAVSTAKRVKKSNSSVKDYFYKILDNKMIVDLKNITVELKCSDDGRTLTALFRHNNSGKVIDKGVFTFLDWDHI